MSAAEILYRVWEQAKRFSDRSRLAAWAAVEDFPGGVAGLPGLNAEASRLQGPWRTQIAAEALAVSEGRLAFFARPWPPSPVQPWWSSDVWLLDPISGRRWPGAERFAFDVAYRQAPALGDVKFVWELNRLQVLPPLALQAMVSGDADDAGRVFAILRGWMAANPPYRGVNWISGIEAASRVASLLAMLAFAAPESSQDRAAVRAFLAAHARWIARYPSRFSSANNHQVAELSALFLIGLCAPGLISVRRLRRTRAALERAMQRQFHPDGGGAEQALHYAAYSLEWFTLAGIAAEAAAQPLSSAYRRRAGRAADHLRWLLDGGGQAPLIGDRDAGRVLALNQAPEPRYAASVAAMAARWLKAPSAAQRDPALRDGLTEATPHAPPPAGTRTFARSGLTVWRRPRSDGHLLLAFDHGPLGFLSIAAHGHADALAVWLHWGEEAVFVDAGTYLYHATHDNAAEGARDALRGASAHNTLTLDGRDQSRIAGPFAWTAHARARLLTADADAVEAEHDGYRRRLGLIHRRRVRLQDDIIAIEDRLLGRPKQHGLAWSVGFTLNPDMQVERHGARADLRTAMGRRLEVTAQTGRDEPIPWDLTSTLHAPCFGRLQSAPRLQLCGILGTEPLVCRTRIRLLPHHDSPT